jgi:4-amino-4-deoxy-L-arabinose transferase-like glycosyltransferase
VAQLTDILRFGDLTLEQSLPFWPAFALTAASYFLFFAGRKKLGLFFLFLGSGMLGLAMAALDPFLWIWDEQYHALVAKHLADDPLRPVLVQLPILGYDNRNWVFNHIWLHKQPLFLWQMALSIKLLGATEMAVRLPSVLMHAIMPLFIYRMGRLAVNAETGFIAGLFFAFASFPLTLISGAHATDHNDVAFLFYVTASCWAWFELQRSGAMRWALAVGLLAGCAIMVKWLSGLLVFGIWVVGAFAVQWPQLKVKETLRQMLAAFAVCVAVALPWQLYVHRAFPAEALHERDMMHRHFSEAVEFHSGDWLFHFTKGVDRIYGAGDAVPWLLLLGLVVLMVRTDRSDLRYGMAAAVVAVYGFYSMAATKMIAFPLIVAPIVFLGLGALTDGVMGLLRAYVGRRGHLVLRLAACVAVCVMLLDMHMIAHHHALYSDGKLNEYRAKKLSERALADQLHRDLAGRPHVLFNVARDFGGDIHLMFFTDHVAFAHLPTLEQVALSRIALPEHPIVVMDKGQPLPEYLLTCPDVRILRWEGVDLE